MKIYHLLALVPFIVLLGGVGLANKVTPYVAGMPFILFYIVTGVVLISIVMSVIYKLDTANEEGDAE